MKTTKDIAVFTFGALPEMEFEEGGHLYEADWDAKGYYDKPTKRVLQLYAAIGASTDDEEIGIGELPDGRLCITDVNVTGAKFAIEANVPESEA